MEGQARVKSKWDAMKPCEHVVYLHFLMGGMCDGEVLPCDQICKTIQMANASNFEEIKATYELASLCVEEIDAHGWEMVFANQEEYAEPVYYRVNMRPKL